MKLLCIILDGMTKKAFNSLKNAEKSVLGNILKNSGGKEIVSTFPSETAAANATLLTGQRPSDHGLVGNEFFLKDNFFRINFDLKTDAPSLLNFVNYECLNIETPTIFEKLGDNGFKTSSIHAIYRGADISAPDFFVEKNKKWKFRKFFASFLAKYLILGARGINSFNQYIINIAIKIVKLEDPDFMVLWIPFMDKIAHDYNLHTSLNTLMDLDKSFRKLFPLIKDSKIMVMSDHGHSSTPKKVDLVSNLSNNSIKASYIKGNGLLKPPKKVLVSQNGRMVFIKCDEDKIDGVIKTLKSTPEVDQVIYEGKLINGSFSKDYPFGFKRTYDLISGKYACRTGNLIVTFKPGFTIKNVGKSQSQHSSMHYTDSLAPFYVSEEDKIEIGSMDQVFDYILKLMEN